MEEPLSTRGGTQNDRMTGLSRKRSKSRAATASGVRYGVVRQTENSKLRDPTADSNAPVTCSPNPNAAAYDFRLQIGVCCLRRSDAVSCCFGAKPEWLFAFPGVDDFVAVEAHEFNRNQQNSTSRLQ
jgi:hypothetical protein